MPNRKRLETICSFWICWVSAARGTFCICPSASANVTLLPLNQWNHFACTRDGSNVIRMFINGVAAGSATNAINLDSSYGPQGSPWTTILGSRILDNNVSSKYTGYISGARIVVGTVLYTSTFTPPTTPLTAISNTQLLLSGTNGGIIDQSSRNNLITVGSAQVSSTQVKYGTGSLKFNGTTDYLKGTPSILQDINATDFTIEFWVYFNSVSSSLPLISKYGNAAESAGGQGYFLDWVQSSTSLRFVLGSAAGVTDNVYTFSWSPAISTWYHVAITKAGSSGRAFINGVQIGSTTTMVTSDIASPNSIQIGKTHTVAAFFNGYIDDFRITRGYARYTTTFTPPTQQLIGQ